MKVGDKVTWRDMPEGVKYAEVVSVDIKVKPTYVDTLYYAKYHNDDKCYHGMLKFRGCQIGKTVFKVEGSEQLSIFDWLKEKENMI